MFGTRSFQHLMKSGLIGGAVVGATGFAGYSLHRNNKLNKITIPDVLPTELSQSINEPSQPINEPYTEEA